MGVLRRSPYFDSGGNLIDGPMEDVSKAPDVAGLPWVRREAWTTRADRDTIRALLLDFLANRPQIRTWVLTERTRAPVNAISISWVEPDDQYLILSIGTTTTSGCGNKTAGPSCEVAAPFPVAARTDYGFQRIFYQMAKALDVLCGLDVIGPTTDTRFFSYLPTETPDGVITDFTIPQRYRAGREAVYLNGLRQRPGVGFDYETVESGGTGAGYDTIRFTTAPSTGDWILVDYEIVG